MSLLLGDVAHTSLRVAETSARLEKIGALVELLRRGEPEEAPLVVSWLSGELWQGRIGLGWAAVQAARPDTAAAEPALRLLDVDRAFDRVAEVRGAGSARARVALFRELLEAATRPEQEFLVRLVFGELRQGALEGVMAEAIARAADVGTAEVRRAAMFAGALGEVARAALEGGAAALGRFAVTLFRPVQPMLAQPAEGLDEVLSRLGVSGSPRGDAPWGKGVALDWKLDGARVQVHKRADEVRVFSRRLNEVTASVPELVEVARSLPARELVLDGEAIALLPGGGPRPFQETMRRFGRKLDVERMRAELPLSTFFFDCLYADGEPLLDRPAGERFGALEDVVPPALRIPRLVTRDASEAQAFLRSARSAGHEGVVAKDLEAAYEAGRRGGSWLKVKEADTLDLVVLAAEWGHGRRQGRLSNLHLGARDPAAGGYVMLGKTFKGLTDALLEWQTAELLKRELGREGHIVHVRPELVVEIAFEGLQASPRYPGGLALRFARVKRYRPDKTPAQADTIDRVRSIHQHMG